MGMKWQVPDLCHVNGATWFSGGAVSHTQHNIYKCALSYFSKYTLRIIHGTLCLLYKAHIAQCAHFAMHRLSLTSVPYALCRMCFVPCAMYHCALYHVPCTECALYRSLTLDNGPSVSRSALLIEFLHRGHFPNEGTAKNKWGSHKRILQLWSFAKTPG